MSFHFRRILAALLAVTLIPPVSVDAVSSVSQYATDTYDYDAFGNLIHSTGATPNNYLFAGEQFDPDLGLYYNRARYLNVSTGRFWTMDTKDGRDETPSSLHKYLYTAADPIDNLDPSGNEIDAAIGSFGVSDTINAFSLINYRPDQTYRIASTVSERGIEFLKIHEGFFPTPSDKDGAGNCTIGYGHLIRFGQCKSEDFQAYPMPLTRDAGEQLLFNDIYRVAILPMKFLIQVPLAQREFDALVDFAYNVGDGLDSRTKGLTNSTLLRVLNFGYYNQVPSEFLRYHKSNSPPGLLTRRSDEAWLWSTGIYISYGKRIP